MAIVEREPTTGVTGLWGGASRGLQRLHPLPKAETPLYFWNFNESGKFAHFFLKFGNTENHVHALLILYASEPRIWGLGERS